MSSIFGEFLNFDYLHFNRVCNGANNKWVWFPKSKNHKLTSMVYTHFNNSVGNHDTWNGWGNLWRLFVAPRPKHFIWLLLHNGIKTYEYLYRLNLGAQTFCKFCNLDFENAEHLFNSCPKTQIVWQQVSNAIGKQIVFHEGFSTGNWLSPDHPEYDLNVQSIIGVTSWLIWKTRCNLIFRQESPDFQSIPIRAINHVREFSQSSNFNSSKQLILSNFSINDGPYLFVASTSHREANTHGAGFHLTNGYSQFVCAGYCNNFAESTLEAKSLALLIALGSLHASDLQVKTIFIACSELFNIIKHGCDPQAWRLNPLILSINDYLSSFDLPRVCIIPKAWMNVANNLAIHGVNSHALTLFHQGKDLPRWLMKQVLKSGISL
ncbi:uncharacterized protein LOC120273975 [Dioscorea cayenensis subsp. rotundata]|uniref:Uncharacterized protein LOC120273975 n=1 Tax=Dioscorea cayennensis subsp. rotundata TaxID=55577 RepID=A0AB40CA10_DIOCR|nr:uncharacterized protein LOC120273975 [Dioscorea cayenensis subsp. rotundata]